MCKTSMAETTTTQTTSQSIIRERKGFYLPDDPDEVANTLSPLNSNLNKKMVNLSQYSPSQTNMPIVYPPRSRSSTPNKDQKEIKKSMSFAGFGMFISNEEKEVTFQEIATLMDPKKREPNKVIKEQIKVYSQKYKDKYEKSSSSTNHPWYK